ncbi:MAG: ABC transporter ATP-binding protein [Lachnospiraceae bacterium]|nr:ABC transporter ATP-binding protein [Lachnospiraceae bacterium]
MLEVRNLSFAYKTVPVLEQISFRAEKGRLIAVLGANGAGKSTLFKCILGLLKTERGTIFLAGRDIKEMSRKEIAQTAAYIPQAESPVFNYNVFDTVLMGTTGSLSPLRSPGEKQKQAAEEAISFMGIEDLKERGINEISGGERQLVLLARAMAQKAQILIMDEPTANLDYGNQQHVMSHVRMMAENGYTVLLSTHNPEHALQYATDVLAIKDHRVAAEGKVDEILNEELIERLYGLKVKITEAEVNGRIVRSCIPAIESGE